MKIKILIAAVGFLIFLSGLGSAEDELVMEKEIMPWVSSLSNTACDELIKIDAGEDIRDIRDLPCAFEEGKFTLTLAGPPDTTVTFFGEFSFGRENGFLIIRKKDDRDLWVLDLAAFPDRQWFNSEATTASGAFEAYYQAAPTFEEYVSSIKWGKWWAEDPPGK